MSTPTLLDRVLRTIWPTQGGFGQFQITSAPVAPVALTAVASGQKSVIVTWLPVFGATSYNLYRGTSPGTETLYQAGVSSGYPDPNIVALGSYYYKVTAVNSAGESELSNEVSITISPPSGPSVWIRSRDVATTSGSIALVAADSQFLSAISAVGINPGSGAPFAVSAWFYANSTTNFGTIASTLFAGWELRRFSNSQLVEFGASGGAGTYVQSGSTFTNNTWNFVLAWQDPVAGTLNIQLNNGPPVSIAALLDNTGLSTTLTIGARNSPTDFWDGFIDSLIIMRPPTLISALIADIGTTLFNGGSGLSGKDITSAQRTAWGAVTAYDADGQRNLLHDYIGPNNLTNTSSVVCGVGKITTTTIADNDAAVLVPDHSGNADDASEPDASLAPAYVRNVQNGLPGLQFFNSPKSRLLLAAAGTISSDYTAVGVGSFYANTHAGQGSIWSNRGHGPGGATGTYFGNLGNPGTFQNNATPGGFSSDTAFAANQVYTVVLRVKGQSRQLWVNGQLARADLAGLSTNVGGGAVGYDIENDEPLVGMVFEHLNYPRYLDDDDLHLLFDYLGLTYANY